MSDEHIGSLPTATMTDAAPKILDWLLEHSDELLDAVFNLVAHESPSRDKAALDALSPKIAGRFEKAGLSVGAVENSEGGNHLVARLAGPVSAPRGLVMGHFDTVWPHGTLDRLPIRVEGDRAYGPGIYDMKSGLVLVEFAIRALGAMGLTPPRPIDVLLTSDEEIGSPTSRRLIEETARDCAYALVPEPPLANGSLKTARKGVGRFELVVEGRAAHAGVEPEKGVSATVELAHQVLAVQALNDFEAGTTLNIGLIEGGTTPNVVPASARAVIDARAWTLAEAARVEENLRGLKPVLPGAGLTIHGGFNRPPMERTPATADLFFKGRDLGRLIGLELGEGPVGGGSDGNFTAALGVPTLDGLGAPGGGAHADHEHILIETLPMRAALLALLLLTL